MNASVRKPGAEPTADMKRKESEPMSKILDTTVLVDIIRTSNVRHFSMIEGLRLEKPY